MIKYHTDVLYGFRRSRVQHLLVGLIFGVDGRLTPDSLVQDLVPDVHYKEFYRRYRTPTLFKTHELPQPRYRRVIWLVRDGRDVMVSYFHHLSALKSPLADWEKLAIGDGIFPCPWHEHVDAWLANSHESDLMIVKYEMLKTDPVRELRRISKFVGLERDASALKFAARTSAFQVMKEKELKFGWANSAWPKDKAFVRKGQIGSYKEEMPSRALEMFMERSAKALARLGYTS
jgi:hypothetical protein